MKKIIDRFSFILSIVLLFSSCNFSIYSLSKKNESFHINEFKLDKSKEIAVATFLCSNEDMSEWATKRIVKVCKKNDLEYAINDNGYTILNNKLLNYQWHGLSNDDLKLISSIVEQPYLLVGLVTNTNAADLSSYEPSGAYSKIMIDLYDLENQQLIFQITEDYLSGVVGIAYSTVRITRNETGAFKKVIRRAVKNLHIAFEK